MFNFLNPKLLPRASCDSAATDNYEVDNLVSDNFLVKARGFLAYSSIKPPVELKFEFICPVDISYIVLNTTVGSQKVKALEVYAKTQTLPLELIGKSLYDRPGVIFCDGRKYKSSTYPVEIGDYHQAYLMRNTFKIYEDATELLIRITRTEKSVPCLGSIEVWGHPSKSCSSVTKETVNRLICNVPAQVTCDNGSSDFEIPEEYKDDLTHELMTLPVTLPSGKTVDQSTLDKYIENEAKFGRKPGDPFTGLKFNARTKPVLNVALKSRIDMFLLRNSDNPITFSLKRTVGHMDLNQEPSLKKSKSVIVEDNSLSLDDKIKTLMSDSSFKNFSSQKPSSKCSCSNKSVLYILPCKHFICRPCLLHNCNNLLCPHCKESYKSELVERYYGTT